MLLCSFSDQTPLGSNLQVLKQAKDSLKDEQLPSCAGSIHLAFGCQRRAGFSQYLIPRSPSISEETHKRKHSSRKAAARGAHVCGLGFFRRSQLQSWNWVKRKAPQTGTPEREDHRAPSTWVSVATASQKAKVTLSRVQAQCGGKI